MIKVKKELIGKECVIQFWHDDKTSQGYLPENWKEKHCDSIIRNMVNHIQNTFNPDVMRIDIFLAAEYVSTFHKFKYMTAQQALDKMRKEYKKGELKFTVLK